MMFWQVFALLSVAAMLFLLWPMLMAMLKNRHSDARELGSVKASESVFEDHLTDLQRARDEKEITEQEFASLKRDLEKTHATDLEVKDSLTQVDSKLSFKQRAPLWAVAISMPIIAVMLYNKLGASEDWNIYQLAIKPVDNQEQARTRDEELIQKLVGRVKTHPDNASNWYLLASKSTALGKYDEAVGALQKLREMEPSSALVIGELAQAQFLKAGNKVTQEVRDNAELALALSPTNSTALGLKGIDAYQSRRFKDAIESWTLALRVLDPKSAAAKAFSQGITQAQIGLVTQSKSSDKTVTQKSTNAKSEESKSKTESAAVGDALVVDVSMDESLVRPGGTETVFVYARAWQGAKMPLAIKRFSVSELPTQITLSTSDAMAPGMDIASTPKLEVLARLSKSGQAVPQSGDWQGSFGPVSLSDQKTPIKLNINKKLP